MRITDDHRRETEDRIRAATDRLLSGSLAPGMKCDIKSLSIEAGVSRAALYATYSHLKDEFERRRDHLHHTGIVLDPREAQINRLKGHNDALRARIERQDNEIAGLREFRSQAVFRLAAQHEEIQRLRGLTQTAALQSLPTTLA
ncbi:hypothetical protein [Nocardia sp. NPDC047038]|uniref:hypothetical protein n=1 Tax=Nocardia sp. NPDC047038 TaxID=3154338 RepID=UPI00340C82D7